MVNSDRDSEFRRLYDEHFDALRSYCLRRLPLSDANEAVAEVFVVAWRRSDVIPDPHRVRAWLYGIARNVVAHSQRSHARRLRLSNKAASARAHPPVEPDSAAVESTTMAQILHELSELPAADREVLELRVWEELTAVEIAEVVGVSVSAAEKRVTRAYRKLEDRLQRVGLIDVASGRGGAR